MFTKFAHDVFMGIGKQVGVQPKTTVSILETFGMISIVGLLSVGSIKIYQWSTGSIDKSINDRLFDLNNKINSVSVDIKKEINTIRKQNTDHFTIIQDQFHNAAIRVRKLENDIINIGKTQELLNSNITQQGLAFNNLQNKFQQTIINTLQVNTENINKKIDDLKHLNTESIDPIVQNEFNILINELKSIQINQMQTTNLIRSNSESKLENLATNKITFPHFQRVLSNSNIANNERLSNIESNLNSYQMSLPLSTNKPITFTSYRDRTFKISESSETRIVFDACYDSTVSNPSTAVVVARRMFNNLPVDFIAKTLLNSVSNVIAGSMTLATLNELLNVFGIGSSSVSSQSTSGQLGHGIVRNIREFINEVSNEIKRK
jgi:hypothetical protein